MFGMLKGLVGSKSLSREDMESVLDKMRDHLIGEPVEQGHLCLWGRDGVGWNDVQFLGCTMRVIHC